MACVAMPAEREFPYSVKIMTTVRMTGADAGMQTKAVLIVYRHRLFRDVIAQVLRKEGNISLLGATRSRDDALKTIEDLGTRPITLVVETESQINLERGTLPFLLRATQEDPRARVVAVTLGGAGIAFRSWHWLDRIDSEQLVEEIVNV